jgi:hypothetical protein
MSCTNEEIEWIDRINNVLCPHCRTPGPQIVFWCGDMIGPRSKLKCDCGCIWNQDWENQKITYIGPSAAEQYEKQYEVQIAVAVEDALDKAMTAEEDELYDKVLNKFIAENDDEIEHRFCEALRQRRNELYAEVEPQVRKKFEVRIGEALRRENQPVVD